MNLLGAAFPLVSLVNRPVTATVKYSTGYRMGPGARQVPEYATVEGVRVDVQPLSSSDLKLLDGLNIQGVQRAIYMYGDTQGVDRPASKGGDLIVIGADTWKVVAVLETWANWCKVGVTKQMDTP
ncbi:hypothetical protein [Bordetella sp. 02P26C-1]|uniref:hypothetical protein n=1 Tax=Bordetella sp. 02P26C-1 TaxID=2683195 RepID=UPI0013551772|nr:hypothetical protein [Bordetella sp. 02P26C-1]MVW80179.1 hypothetical protein [Bordetella sp. 02P26C-1]